MRAVGAFVLSVLALCLYINPTAAETEACKACPDRIRGHINIFCSLPWVFLKKKDCMKMSTDNTDLQLKEKVCNNIGVCGARTRCGMCRSNFKGVMKTLCSDIGGVTIGFGSWEQTNAMTCKFLVEITPTTYYTVACQNAGCERCDNKEYGYGSCNGPDTWAAKYASQCGGNEQTPINIVPTDTDNSVPNFSFSKDLTAKLFYGIVYNTGKTLKFVPDYTYQIKNPLLDFDYYFLQLHFHWGATDDRGSEHLLNGQSYPLEMHLVHVKKGLTVGEALNDPDGLLVLGVFFEIVPNSQAGYVFDKELETILDAKDQLKEKVKTGIKLDFIPTLFSSNFYAYMGSLTTPPCSEVVQWLVAGQPLPITKRQLASFRALEDKFGQPLVDNYRPVQPINGRDVFHANP